MKRLVLSVAMLLAFSASVFASSGFTQKDRERLIRLEATLQTFMHQVDKRFEQIDKRFEQVDRRFEELRQDMNKRFEQVDRRFEQVDKRFELVDKRIEELRKDTNKRFEELRQDMNARFDQMNTYILITVTAFASLVAATIGFALWDRKTMIKQASREIVERMEKEGKVVNVLRELAKTDSRLAEILKMHGLL